MAEFAGADMGDARLTKRLVKLADRLGDAPSASIPGACNGRAETQAAYRLFDQAREEKRGLGWEEVLAPHMARTETRMAEHPVVLCLQDTTELDFNGQDMDGLGRLSYEAQRGMYLHPTYVVTPQRLPLGIVDAWMWARPLEVSESQRWIEGYARLAERAGHLPATRLVYVADREADILELMQRAHTLGHPADYLLRAQHNRCLPQGGKLWPAVLAATPLGDIEFTLPERLNRPARAVRQTLHVRPVDLPDGQGGMMPVTCLIARETGVPEGQKAVEWRLLTNRVVATLEEAAQLIDWYRCRWEIETLFHVLKNGCRVESLQLGHVRKLELALAIYLVVAWRLAHLTRLGRILPDLPASAVFEQTEWQAAWLLAEKPPPRKMPTLREVIRRIAMLGGFLARKGDGEPGVKTLWQGYTRLSSFVRGVEQMRSIHAL
ncbi:IS4 family transposase [Zoogloea sp.]|uniref:IS4 family transposase n=1 Tax=Zoogloea sp. TaxID=49181 RepID=UPI0026367408|nr:IS4 family transposase [Zoogloea sp.]